MNRFILVMKKNPDMPAKEAFVCALRHYGRDEGESFLQQFYHYRKGIYLIMHYFREKVIRVILDAGICLHVFGEAWSLSHLSSKPNLICHPAVDAVDSIALIQESEVALNVMSWHKAGFTERIANAMLCGAAVVSDKSRYLEEAFLSGTDLLLYDLRRLDELPKRLLTLLSNQEAREAMTKSAYEKALRMHTWSVRAREFLELLP